MLAAGAGRLVSPFANDLFALVALAFKNLYPEREYAAYFVPEVEDGSGGAACGVTTFPEDGSPPVVEVSGEIPIAAGVEIFAHELAHVATPEDREQAAHDPTIAETAQGLSLTFEKLKADISQSRAARFVLAVLEKLKGAIQMEKTLKTGKIGQFGAESRVTYGGVKWVVLDARPNMSLCLAEDVLKDENGEVRYMAFDTDNKNDFAASSVRAFLNGDFLEELAAAGADKEAFVPIVLDLTSDDGLDDYGTDSAKIGLITDQMYRAFRKIIPKASEDYWTCTPFSTERNGYKSFVRFVYTSGALNDYYACLGWGVRPLCALKSDILVSYDEGEVNERKPSFGEMIGKALAEGLNKAIFGEGEEPKGILAEAEAQAAHEKEQEDEDQKRADAVDMMKHIAAAFDIPATIGEGKQEEQEKEAKQLFGWYSELKKAGFTDAQAFELIKG